MLRKWIAAHRSLVATATSCTIVGALVVAVAVVSTGYTAQRLDLNDASVWVTNNAEQSIGRANTAVLELNTVVAGSGNDLDVLQSGSTVLTVDRANAKVDIVDAATSTVTDSVPLPPNRPEVYLAGQTAVVLSRGTGELWIVPLPELASFDAQSPPTLSLGAGAVASMDDAGLMFVYSPTTRQVFRIDPQRSDAALGSDKVSIPASATVTMSSVAGRWAILSATGPTLYVPGHTINLSTRMVGAAVIQQASSTGNDVLVADSTRLVRVPLDGTAPVTVSTAGNGPPARPLVANGCEFAAWSGGSAWRGCANDGALGHPLSLSGVPAASSLSFRANGNRVVLNDAHAGASWAVQDNGQLIDNWADLIAPKDQH
ncbi:MAG: large repetitive protein, partial [Actinomycetota bacterium]|nr:large repetitive protein [Actinomycetota bacterium]